MEGRKVPLKLSICIVAYHNYEDILHAVETIERYTDQAIKKKIYIVDNDPKWDWDQRLKQELERYEDVIYIGTESNLGFGKGHNLVLPYLDSAYHAIVNPDILLVEDSFASITGFMDEHEDIGMVVPRITSQTGKMQRVYRRDLTIFDMFVRMFCRKLFPRRMDYHTLGRRNYSKSFQVPFAQGSFLVCRTDLLKALHGFDDRYFMYLEDADLCRRVNLVSKLVYYPDTSVIHKWERGSHKSKKLFRHHLVSMYYYFKKWGVRWI